MAYPGVFFCVFNNELLCVHRRTVGCFLVCLMMNCSIGYAVNGANMLGERTTFVPYQVSLNARVRQRRRHVVSSWATVRTEKSVLAPENIAACACACPA